MLSSIDTATYYESPMGLGERVSEEVERLRKSFARPGEIFYANLLLRGWVPGKQTLCDYQQNIVTELHQQGYRDIRFDTEHVVDGLAVVYSGQAYAEAIMGVTDGVYTAVYAKPPKHF